MLLAYDRLVVWVGAVVSVGVVVVVVAALLRGVNAVRQRLSDSALDVATARLAAAAGRTCRRARCEHVNHSGAQFCARCGQPLG